MDDTKADGVPEYSGKWWLTELRAAEKELKEAWKDSANTVVSRYLDRREDGENNKRKYNLFWANVQILKSALYATPPRVEVSRQYNDAKDDVARTAALILQRMLSFDMTKDDSESHESLKMAVEDRLIPGLGQVWLRLDTQVEDYKIEPVLGPDGVTVLAPGMNAKRIVSQDVPADYVHWDDYLWSPARTWGEVWWQSRRLWMRKREFIKRWGEAKYKEVKDSAETSAKVDGQPKGFRKGRVQVYEVWCEPTDKVYFVCETLEENLEEIQDPLGLQGFFPCPKPLLATHTTNSVVPRPDYIMMQDQYEELNILNARVSTLTEALRVVGVYDSANKDLGKLLSGQELNMIPVDSWAAFAESGGMKGTVDWFPVEQVANVLEKLMQQRQAVVGQIYELSGISDIMRGASNPRETAKAQSLKAQYSSVRLQLNQQDIGKFVREVLRLKAEIICKHFDPEQIKEQSQIKFTESVQYAEPAIQLLKNYKQAEYRLEVNEQSLSLADYNAEREMRIELITAIGQFLSQSAQTVQTMPASLPYMLRILQWVVASFRGSMDIESVLDEAVDAATKNPPQGEQEKPDMSVQVEQVKQHGTQQIEQIRQNTTLQLENMRMSNDKLLEGMRAQLEQLKQQHENSRNEENNATKKLIADLQARVDLIIAGKQSDTTVEVAHIGAEAKPELKGDD
jgi:hypothetical protein